MTQTTFTGTYKAETKRDRLELLRAQLENERSSFLSHWRQLGEYILPRRPRFTLSDVNRGDRRSQNIIDSTATLAARTLRSGMMAGITSPARPWFRLTTPEASTAEAGPVKEWLELVGHRMATAFLRSNLYKVLPVVYGDMGVFGTAAMVVEEDFDDIVRFEPMPIGSYMIANNERMQVDVFFREFRMTVRQLIQKFARKDYRTGKYDLSNFSLHVQDLYKNGHMETWVDVCHVVQPNQDYKPDKLEPKFKRFTSCYYERGFSGTSGDSNYMAPIDPDIYLRESGFDFFPVLAPRWEITGEDSYGSSCPGMEALGDIKQLQTGEKRIAQAVEKLINPPMTGPTVLRNTGASILPGGHTWVDVRDGQGGFRPSHVVDPKILELENKQVQIRQRISKTFYEDLFLMLAQSDRRNITAREIEERHEEKLLALGPVLEQLNQDLLNPLIDITFDIMVDQGHIPEAPEELQGSPLRVEFVSIMAQAQKLAGVSGIERFAGFVGQIASTTQDPTILDKIDMHQMIDVYAEMTSVPAGIVRSDEAVAEIQQDRAAAQKEQAMKEDLVNAAKGAKDLAGAKLEEDSALKRLIDQSQAGQLTQAA